MNYKDVTRETVLEAMLEPLKGTFDVQEGSVAYTIMAAAAYELSGYFEQLVGLEDMAFISENSGEYIEKRAAEYGLTRKQGTRAEVTLTFFGVKGAVVPEATAVEDSQGQAFITEAQLILDESGTGQILAYAAEGGAAGNVGPGEICFLSSDVDGVGAVTNQEAASGGTDGETDQALLNRLNLFRRRPISAGNKAHYEQWALEVDDVGAAQVVPLENGPGTVGLYLAGYDGGPVSQEVLGRAAAHLEEVRPIGATVFVKSVEPILIAIAAEVVLEERADPEIVKAEFMEKAVDYLAESALEGERVVKINRLGAMLMDVEGVLDYAGLTLNGATANIPIPTGKTAALGEVSFT